MIGMADLGGKPVFLIGYRGTGKSAVARELAQKIGYAWTDADELIETQAGKSITAIFADDGEAAFRDLESTVVAALVRQQDRVVALGGGAVLRDENRAAIRAAGPVVWLTASVDTILSRIAADETTASRRPPLTSDGGRTEVESLLAARTPLYGECATLTVDTEGKTPTQIADEILSRMDS
jgi:shikimate kinase